MEIVLIHGFRGNHLGFRDVAKFLRKAGFSVYVPDLPPAGKYPLAKYDAEHYAKWVADYILEKKLNRPVVIGHSMGSIIAAATAEKYPEIINQKIIFLAPISTRPARIFSFLAPGVIFLPNSLISYITTRFLIVKKGRSFFKKTVELTRQCAAQYTSRLDVAKAAFFSANHAISDFSFKRDAYFLDGETDRLSSQQATLTVAAKYSGKAEFIPNAGHLLNYEVPEQVAQKIADFINA